MVLDTSFGPITIELDQEKAPITVENFLKYVDDGFYDNLIFHRVMPRFMIQGGGFDPNMREKSEGQKGKIKNESGNGLSNVPRHDRDGTHARSQFGAEPVFHQPRRQQRGSTTAGGGYAVFGKVIDGMDVVNKIAKVEDDDRGPARMTCRVEPVVIKTARRKAKN